MRSSLTNNSVFEPYWLVVWGVQEQLEVVKSHPFEEGHGVVDLGVLCTECFWLGLEVQFAFKQEPSKFLWVSTIEQVRVLDLH